MAIEDWYDAQRQGLGTEFRDEVDAAIARVANNPLIYPERYRGARRALLRRFPYVLWYRSYDTFVVVLSLAFTASAIPVLSALDFSGAPKLSQTPPRRFSRSTPCRVADRLHFLPCSAAFCRIAVPKYRILLPQEGSS